MNPIDDLRSTSGLLECGLGDYTTLSPEALQAYQDPDQSGEELMSRFLRDNRQLMMEAGQWMVEQQHDPRAPTVAVDVFPGPAQPMKRIASRSTIKSELSYQGSQAGDSPRAQVPDQELSTSDIISSRARKLYYNIILVGDSGLGKTSFLHAFLRLRLNRLAGVSGCERVALLRQTTEIVHNRAVYSTAGLEIHFDVIDTPGYGTAASFRAWQDMIEGFIANQTLEYAKAKENVPKGRRIDSRIHLCLYFMEGVRVKDLDLKALHSLQRFVSIVPVLSKSESYTEREILQAKLEVVESCARAGIRFFDCLGAAPTKAREMNEAPLGPCPPFALLSHCDLVSGYKEKPKFGRKFHWGVCDIENPKHSDFSLLCKLLIGHFLLPCREEAKKFSKKPIQHQHQHTERDRKRRLMAVASVVSAVTLGLFSFLRR